MRKSAATTLAILAAGLLLSACGGATVQIGIEPEGGGQPTRSAVGAATDTPGETITPTPTMIPTSADEETPTAEPGAGNGAAGETTIIPADWVETTNPTYGVSFRHPPGWTLDPAYTDRLSGPEGFVQFGAMGGPDLTDPADACQQQANHVLMPFGSDPRIDPIMVDGQDGCLIVPGGAGADAMGGQQEAIIRYPQPVMINGISYEYLTVDADETHMAPILVSLCFMETVGMLATPTPLPTPSPLHGDDSAAPKVVAMRVLPILRDLPRGAPVTVEWTAQGAETLLCTRERLRNHLARNEACQQVPMEGAFGTTAPTDEEVFALEVIVTAYGLGVSDQAVETVWLACTETWFLTEPPPTCPAYPPGSIEAVGQQFEHGWMVYADSFVSPQKLVFVFFEPPPNIPRNTFLVFEAPDPQAPSGVSDLYPPDPHFWPIVQRAEMTTWGDAGDGIGAAVSDVTAYPASLQWEHAGEAPGWYFMNGPGDVVFQFSAFEWMASGVGIGDWHYWKPAVDL